MQKRVLKDPARLLSALFFVRKTDFALLRKTGAARMGPHRLRLCFVFTDQLVLYSSVYFE